MADEVYIEFTPAGASVKVTAIDAATGVEVSIIGPSNAYQGDLEQVAVAKLAKRLGRRQERGAPKEETPPVPGRGIIV